MDRLADDLQRLLHDKFKANLRNFSFDTYHNQKPVWTMHGPVLAAPTKGQEHRLEFTVEESEEIMMHDTANSWYVAIRKDLIGILLKDCGKLMAMRVDRVHDYHPMWRSTVELMVFNPDRFHNNVKNYYWNAYSEEFDQLMNKTLTD